MASRTTRSVFFIVGLVAVVGVIALLYLTGPNPGKPVTMPETNAEDPHSEITMLEQMWKDHPGHAPIALQLGNLYAAENEHAKAVEYYREFLKLDTSSTGWEVRLDVAKSLYGLGRPGEAKAEVQRILDRQPNHPGALYNMGALEANMGQNVAARAHWEQLIATNPQDTLARFAQESLKQLK